MSKILHEFEFDLKDPIQIHKDGVLTPSTKIILKAPTNMHRFHLTRLKQGFLKAMLTLSQAANNQKSQNRPQLEDKRPNKDKDDLKAPVILLSLMTSNFDFNDYMDVFKEFVCNNIAFVEGNQLLPHMFDQINMNEQEQILGKYIEVFLQKDWMDNFKALES